MIQVNGGKQNDKKEEFSINIIWYSTSNSKDVHHVNDKNISRDQVEKIGPNSLEILTKAKDKAKIFLAFDSCNYNEINSFRKQVETLEKCLLNQVEVTKILEANYDDIPDHLKDFEGKLNHKRQ